MEEILHHLGCIKLCKLWDKLPYQLVQDFFHQQYHLWKVGFIGISPLRSWDPSCFLVHLPWNQKKHPKKSGGVWTYCWWKKKHRASTTIYRVLYISGGFSPDFWTINRIAPQNFYSLGVRRLPKQPCVVSWTSLVHWSLVLPCWKVRILIFFPSWRMGSWDLSVYPMTDSHGNGMVWLHLGQSDGK